MEEKNNFHIVDSVLDASGCIVITAMPSEFKYEKVHVNLPEIDPLQPDILDILKVARFYGEQIANLEILLKELSIANYSACKDHEILEDFFDNTLRVYQSIELDILHFISDLNRLQDKVKPKIYSAIIESLPKIKARIMDLINLKEEKLLPLFNIPNMPSPKSVKPGQTLFINFPKYGVIEGYVLKVNPKTAEMRFTATLRGKEQVIINNINYSQLHFTQESVKPFEFTKSKYYSLESLQELFNELRAESRELFKSLFSDSEFIKLESIPVFWGGQVVTSNWGTCNAKESPIYIVISSALRYCPAPVIKYTIFHECLHIHFLAHGTEFKQWEHKFKNYESWDLWENNYVASLYRYGHPYITSTEEIQAIRAEYETQKFELFAKKLFVRLSPEKRVKKFYTGLARSLGEPFIPIQDIEKGSLLSEEVLKEILLNLQKTGKASLSVAKSRTERKIYLWEGKVYDRVMLF